MESIIGNTSYSDQNPYKPKYQITRRNILNKKSANDFQIGWRFLRKYVYNLLKKKQKKTFTNILFVTLEEPPYNYISAFRKQYPDKNFKVIIPISSIRKSDKPCFEFEYFYQNRICGAALYKLKPNIHCIDVYGIYLPNFKEQNILNFQLLVSFVKALRIVVSRLKPEIVHVDSIPFYLGEEFEHFNPKGTKIIQTVRDFSVYEENTIEPFWAAINLVDKKGMKKIYNDKIITKCIAMLFNIRNTLHFYQLEECLDLMYQNYDKYRLEFSKSEQINENFILNKLNAQIVKIFPQMKCENENGYNIISHTLTKVDFWTVCSKFYYKTLLSNLKNNSKMYECINKTKNKSDYTEIRSEHRFHLIHNPFTVDDFREERIKNKKYLLREFSKDRIKTGFVDSGLFEKENPTILGDLSSCTDFPLLFYKCTNVHMEGAETALSVITQLFDQHKNIQVIINIPSGLKNKTINAFIDYIEQKPSAHGRLLLIDGEIKVDQFYAAADMALYTPRGNTPFTEHFVAMKYGCIPIALNKGIYNDSIVDIFDDMTTGCGFKTRIIKTENNMEVQEFYQTLMKAIHFFNNNSASWNVLIKNAMHYDCEWKFDIIEKYNEIYSRF